MSALVYLKSGGYLRVAEDGSDVLNEWKTQPTAIHLVCLGPVGDRAYGGVYLDADSILLVTDDGMSRPILE